MAPSGNRRGYTREEPVVETPAAVEDVELVTTDAGVQVTPEQAEATAKQVEHTESLSNTPEDAAEEEYQTVRYVGEQPTQRTQYGTFVKDQDVRLPAGIVAELTRTSDSSGVKIFKVV